MSTTALILYSLGGAYILGVTWLVFLQQLNLAGLSEEFEAFKSKHARTVDFADNSLESQQHVLKLLTSCQDDIAYINKQILPGLRGSQSQGDKRLNNVEEGLESIDKQLDALKMKVEERGTELDQRFVRIGQNLGATSDILEKLELADADLRNAHEQIFENIESAKQAIDRCAEKINETQEYAQTNSGNIDRISERVDAVRDSCAQAHSDLEGRIVDLESAVKS